MITSSEMETLTSLMQLGLSSHPLLAVVLILFGLVLGYCISYIKSHAKENAKVIGKLDAIESQLQRHLKVLREETLQTESAKIDALSEKLTQVITLQVELTRATEQVSQDLAHQVWNKQELTQLKRIKYEQYYTCVDGLPSYFGEKFKYHAGLEKNEPKDLICEADLLVDLYLPELKEAHKKLIPIVFDFRALIEETAKLSFKNGGNLLNIETIEALIKRLGKIRDALLPIQRELKDSVSTNAIQLLGKINDDAKP
ncbi:hypothetical protein HYO11_16935 [Vibrio parahaemolyticus]|nr:hypothetical protein [Vibrio parahaemolyticus]